MKRLAVGFCLALGITAALAAPVPKDFAPPNYYPTLLGSVWEYAAEGEKEVALAVKVTEVREKDGVRIVRLEQIDGPKSRDYPEEILIDARGVHLLKAADKEIEPPRLDLKPTPKAGEEWDGPHEWRGVKYACTTTVGDAEKVVVPAGTFTALPHTQTYPDSGPQAWTAWYAPGVGRVKFKNYEEKVHVLLKFTPGKESK